MNIYYNNLVGDQREDFSAPFNIYILHYIFNTKAKATLNRISIFLTRREQNTCHFFRIYIAINYTHTRMYMHDLEYNVNRGISIHSCLTRMAPHMKLKCIYKTTIISSKVMR